MDRVPDRTPVIANPPTPEELRGRPNRYPFKSLKIGESFFESNLRKLKSLRNLVGYYQRTFGLRFEVYPLEDRIQVLRLPDDPEYVPPSILKQSTIDEQSAEPLIATGPNRATWFEWLDTFDIGQDYDIGPEWEPMFKQMIEWTMQYANEKQKPYSAMEINKGHLSIARAAFDPETLTEK
jgi:hypothetical protein